MSRPKQKVTSWKKLALKDRWSEADARCVVAAWRRSGKPVQTFAREHGMSSWRLWWWTKKLTSGEHSTETSKEAGDDVVRFVPAVVSPLVQSPAVVVRLPDGVEVEVLDGTMLGSEHLRALLTELRRSGR